MVEKITVHEAVLLTTKALACALRHRDSYTQLHSDRVVKISLDIGKRLKLSEKELEVLKISAQLHDIGKIGIDDSVLLKTTHFEPDEWEFMKTHAIIGSNIVKCLQFDESDQVSEVIRHHHENYDGTGYPDNLAGESIPVCSRIVTIADCYDAMIESRPYHPAKTHADTIKILHEEKHKFDSYIFDKFLALVD